MNPLNWLKQLIPRNLRGRSSSRKNIRGSFRKLLYLGRITTVSEKRLLFFLAIICIVSGIGLAMRLYLNVTIPVPKVASTYTEGELGEPHSINPVYASRDVDRDISRLLFSGLFIYSGNGGIENDLADHLTVSGDGKVYTVTLKKDLLWHDGQPLTADDVVFTIHIIQNPQYKSPLRANWQGVSIEKINDQNIRFTLRTPYTPFIENLTLGIIPKHIWETVTPEQAPLHEQNLKPVGSGPYRFDQIMQNGDGSISWYQIARNDHFHRSGPFIKKIVFNFFKTEDEMFAAWRKGTIEGFGGVSPDQISKINPDKTLLLSLNMPRIFGIFFNSKHAPQLDDIAVRQAIAYAIDRKEIVNQQHQNRAIEVEWPLPWLGNADTSALFPHDLEKAKDLLKNAGWKDQNNDGILEKKKKERGKTTTTTLRMTLTTSDWPDLINTAQIVQSQLKKAGIDVTIEKKSFPDLESSVIRPRNFEMLLFGQVYGYEPDPFAFWHSTQVKDPGLNITFFADKKVDRLLEDIRKTNDPSARAKDYRNFSTAVVKDLPAVFLFSQNYLYLLPADIQNASPVKISLPSDRFNEINKWYRSTKRVFKWGA